MSRIAYARLIRSSLVLLLMVSSRATIASCQTPLKVTACQLANDRGKYNHAVVEVTAFVSHGFEDSALFDPACPTRFDIWVEYGGTVKTGTMYCCGVTADRTRPTQLVIEDIPIPLVEDVRFQNFDRLIHRRPDSIVHATLVGRFFSGRLDTDPKRGILPGFGHMGCCSLLAIQEILSVDLQEAEDLDFRASPDQPDMRKGCSYQELMRANLEHDLIGLQQKAELGERSWAFDNPPRVASDALSGLLKLDEKSFTGLQQKSKVPGRFVYLWRSEYKKVEYMVVVSRPYWLMFFAHDSKKIAWVAIAAYESDCRK